MHGCDLPLYLTGGTALSRKYFQHRYSDDLDFFTNDEPGFSEIITRAFQTLEAGQKSGEYSMERNLFRKDTHFMQVYLRHASDTLLKIDFVNDVPFRVGEIVEDPVLGRVDHWRNILSNKLSALTRMEPKDIADIWAICRNCTFFWPEIMEEALQKEIGIDPAVCAGILLSATTEEISAVKWAMPINPDDVMKELRLIAEEMIRGNDNSLTGQIT